MTTPTISFKHTDTPIDHELETLLTEKLKPLAKYYEAPTLIDVEFRKDAPKQHGAVYVVEVNCTVKGTMYRATAAQETFLKSIDVVRNELDSELRRAKQKRENRFIKGARRIKEMMKWGA